MRQNIFIAILLLSTCSVVTRAQEDVCNIQGHIQKDTLYRTKTPIEKVYLARIDEFDRPIVVDSCQVEAGRFGFKRSLAKDEPVLIYTLKGFDNGDLPLFVEPGTVTIEMPDAAFPMGATVSGTPNNDLYATYKGFVAQCTREQLDSSEVRRQSGGDDWMLTPEGEEEWKRIGAQALITCNANRLQFLLDHNDSPLAPLMMEKELYFMMDKIYARRMLNALAPTLKNHPYYRSYSNVVRALDLKVGAELPDITLPLADGNTATLNDYQGKYVLLDFWASWCAPCRREIPSLVQLFDDTQEQRDKFVIISFSLDDKDKNWRDAIKALGMDKEGWIHCSDLLAWGSPAARMMGVEAIPKAILIDPEGRAISFSLRGETLVQRVKQILSGDLYYQNTPMEEGSEALEQIRNMK